MLTIILLIFLILVINVPIIYGGYLGIYKPKQVWDFLIKIYTRWQPDNKYALPTEPGFEEDITEQLSLIKIFGWIALVGGAVFLILNLIFLFT